MKVNGKDIRPIWLDRVTGCPQIIDQRKLPHVFEVVTLENVNHVVEIIQQMYVRGAPLIGVAAAFGMYLACVQDKGVNSHLLKKDADLLKSARPTAVNLIWGVNAVYEAVQDMADYGERVEAAKNKACEIAEWEAENSRKIGENGAVLIEKIADAKKGRPVNILTHCNAGWLACIEYGTATAPVYIAHDRGIPVHVWVDETRPLNQGARLTAWELLQHGIPHTVITDNAGGYLMQQKMVDMVIVGTDRTAISGDVANKIGTYLKALAAKDNGVPFYVALPSSTFDWNIQDGLKDIPIEERSPEEVRTIEGHDGKGISRVLLTPEKSPAFNPAFDVTPKRLVTGFITERGVCPAAEEEIRKLFPEKG